MKYAIRFLGLISILLTIASSQNQNFKLYYGDPAKLLIYYGIDTSDIHQVHQAFDSTDHMFNAPAAIFLAQRGYYDIVPRLRILFYDALEKSEWLGYDPDEYLYSLFLLSPPDAHQLALKLLDTMKVWRQQNDRRYKKEDVTLALRILLNLGDYSRFEDFDANEVIKRTDTTGVKINTMDFGMYVAFASQSSLRTTVYNRLNSFISHPFVDVRKDVIFTLNEYFRDFVETKQTLKTVASSDPKLELKLLACDYLSQSYNDPFVLQICEQIAPIAKDTSSFLRMISCLEYFQSPFALAALKKIQTLVSPPPGLNSFLLYTIRDYKPRRPKESVPLTTMIDTLGAFVQQCMVLGWVGTDSFVSQLIQNITDANIPLISITDSILCAKKIKQFQMTLYQAVNDSTNSRFLTIEGWKILHYNAQYILDRLPQIPSEPGWNVKLINSAGTKLTGGTLQYYEGSWKETVNNNDGTFAITSTAKTLSLRMTYEYGTQTKSNVSISSDTIVFQTVNAQIQLQNSSGVLLDTGSVQYYAGAWRTFGTTNNGTTNKELLPNSYSFRMTYAYASKDKQQDIGANATVVFQTVKAAVQLQNSQGSLIDQGAVQYYSGAWRDLGITTNGVASKELLPNTYSFRMTYAFASKDKQQDVGINPIVVFQTVNAAVQLKNSLGNLIDQGTVQYYSGAWRTLGTTNNGTTNKELLPNNYSFRMTYEYVSIDKSQDLSVNNTVGFSTVLCTIRVQNTQAQPVNGAIASYYSGAWRQLGNTVNGEVKKELLPVNLTFRVKYGTQQKDEQQNLSTNNVVQFVVQ